MRLIDADSINWEIVEEEHGTRTPAVVACQSLIQNAPTIDPVRHGKWQLEGYTARAGKVYRCTECGRISRHNGNYEYCPNCGAKMDGQKRLAHIGKE